MNIYEEIFLISNLIKSADAKGQIEFDNYEDFKSFFLHNTTAVNIDYFYKLDKDKIIDFEEVGEDGFSPIQLCNIKHETRVYLKKLILEVENVNNTQIIEINNLNSRIADILSFNPNELSKTILTSKKNVQDIKVQINNNPLLANLTPQLEQIETQLLSISKVAENYEEVYKSIVLPVKLEGKAGIQQTVKWAIISIIISSIISMLISIIMK